jgi:hypothetical protein
MVIIPWSILNPKRQNDDLSYDGIVSRPLPGIQAVPFFTEHPPKCGKLAVHHPPIKIIPGTEIFQTIFLFDFCGTLQRAFPNVALNGAARVIFDGEYFLLDDLGLAVLDFLARDLMPVVPDLVNQFADSIHDFCKPY